MYLTALIKLCLPAPPTVTFEHLHSLSLDWHLRKKLGETIRSMDRGIGACDSLMRYLFLFLVPAVGEMIVVIVIFASYFDYLPLAVAVFAFVYVYAIMTILMTLWRKKFRSRGVFVVLFRVHVP